MELKSIVTTLESQIPCCAVDVLSPEEATIVQFLASEITLNMEIPAYYWNLGRPGLEQARVALDGGLAFKPVETYKKPPHADPLMFVFEYIENTSTPGVFILADIHPFISKDSPVLSWEVITRIKNLYHRLKPTDKRIVLLGQGIQLHDSLVRLIPYCEVPLPTAVQIEDHIRTYLPYLAEAAAEQEVDFLVNLSSEEIEGLSRAALGTTLEEISDFLRLYVKEQLTPEGIRIDNLIICAAAEYKTRLIKQMGIELGKPATIPQR